MVETGEIGECDCLPSSNKIPDGFVIQDDFGMLPSDDRTEEILDISPIFVKLGSAMWESKYCHFSGFCPSGVPLSCHFNSFGGFNLTVIDLEFSKFCNVVQHRLDSVEATVDNVKINCVASKQVAPFRFGEVCGTSWGISSPDNDLTLPVQ